MGFYDWICDACARTRSTWSGDPAPQISTCLNCKADICYECTIYFADHGYISFFMTKKYVCCPICVAEKKWFPVFHSTKETQPLSLLFQDVSIEKEQERFQQRIQERVLFWKEEFDNLWNWNTIEKIGYEGCQILLKEMFPNSIFLIH